MARKLTIFTLFTASIAGSLFGLWTVFVVWVKRTRRRMVRQHESASQARRRAWESAVVALRRHQMPFGVFLGGMAMIAFFFGNHVLHGTGGCYEIADQSPGAAIGSIFLGIVFSFVTAVLLMRRMRRSLNAESSFAIDVPASEGSPFTR